MNAVLEAIGKRSSTRSYTKETLTKEELRLILTAGLQAPTARNQQEVHISVLTGESRLVREIEQERVRLLLEEEKDEEQREKLKNGTSDFYYGAPTVLLLSVRKDFYWNRVDAGICVENIALAAQSLGLGSLIIGCIRGAMEGAKKDYFAKEAQFPEDYEFAVAVALGHIHAGKTPHQIDFEKSVSIVE